MEHKLTWEQVSELSHQVSQAVQQSEFEPDYMIGITVGGLVPLGLIAEELDIRKVLTVSASSYDGTTQGEISIDYVPTVDLSGKKILLIDEVAETGKTLQHIADLLREKYAPIELRTAVLVVNKKKSNFVPDYYALETEDWLIFPWEKEE